VAVVALRPAISPPPAPATALLTAAPAAVKPKPVVKLATAAPAASSSHPASSSAKPAIKLATASPPPVAATPKPAAAQDEIANLASAGASPAKPVTAELKPKPKPKPKPATTAGGPAMVQIGAFSSSALADKGWQDATRAAPISGKTKAVEEVQKDGKTFYRTSVAGFASRADAASYCAALKAAGHSCFVK
jgi:hypothetical protein